MKLKALWYCTKNKPYLQVNRCVLPTEYDRYILDKEQKYSAFGQPLEKLNGKIVAESDFEVEKITTFKDYTGYEEYDTHYQTAKRDYERLLQETCLNNQQLDDYLQGEIGYAIHIKNLNAFDKPKKISDFYKRTEKVNPDIICGLCTNYPFDKCKECRDNYVYLSLTKAPQNMCYVFDYLGNKYVLISVHPEWLCLILNGLKDVELRKKVLKEML